MKKPTDSEQLAAFICGALSLAMMAAVIIYNQKH
jgi:hypothetical protein